jgi:hypothetical protein
MEKWIAIEGFDGEFEVSDEGRIRSNRKTKSGIKTNILKPAVNHKGYLIIRTHYKRKRVTFRIHREVAKAFIPNPDNKPQVNHRNGNKLKNQSSNLEWSTGLENAKHAMDNGLWENNLKASKATNEARKTPIIARCIATGQVFNYDSVSAAEEAIGTKHVSAVLNGKRQKAKGYTFERG